MCVYVGTVLEIVTGKFTSIITNNIGPFLTSSAAFVGEIAVAEVKIVIAFVALCILNMMAHVFQPTNNTKYTAYK